MEVGHKETAGIAKQVAETASVVTQHLHNAIEMLNRPGANYPSTKEAIVEIAAAFAETATLQAAQVYQSELLLARIDGGTLRDVKDTLVEHLVLTTSGMSNATATDKSGTFPVGALSRHYQEQLADSYAQAILSLDNIIAAKEFVEELSSAFGDNVFIFGATNAAPDDEDSDTGNIPTDVLAQRMPPLFTAPEGYRPRAG